MSRNEWESGEIKLPSAEYARVRQACQQAQMTHKQRAFDVTQEFWKSLTRKQQTDPGAYREAQNKWFWDQQTRNAQTDRWGRSTRDEARMEAIYDAQSMTSPFRVGKQPKRVQKADVDWPTNRTTEFDMGSASVRFDREKSTLVWSTDDGNHSVDRAHETELAKALFDALKTVKWTRGTGGIFTGNDEYNEPSEDSYSSEPSFYIVGNAPGSNYVTRGFGPVGAADPDAWSRTDDYRDSRGNLVRQSQFPGKAAEDRRVKATMKAADAYYKAMGQSRGKTTAKSTGGSFKSKYQGSANYDL